MRLLDDPPAPGAWNMAFDEALLEGLCCGLSVPTLRFYAWQPAALSLGYAQDAAGVNLEACARFGLDVVRRPTGGRAVLHVAELTYAIAMPAGRESVTRSYCRISGALAEAIRQLGVAAVLEPGAQAAGRVRPADCFALSTGADLVAAGRKVAGAAQVRRGGFLLQHGAVKLAPGHPSMRDLLAAGAEAAPEPAHLATLAGERPEILAERLKRLFAASLGVPWRPERAGAAEEAMAAAIAARRSSALRPPGPPAAPPRATG